MHKDQDGFMIDPQTGDHIHCDRCGLYPATREMDYIDPRPGPPKYGDTSCDRVCLECFLFADQGGEVVR
jgi:hypothetical protein